MENSETAFYKGYREACEKGVRVAKTVEGLLENGGSLCDHPLTAYTRFPDSSSTFYKTICSACQQHGPVETTVENSQIAFWKDNATFRNMVIDNLAEIVREQKTKENAVTAYEKRR